MAMDMSSIGTFFTSWFNSASAWAGVIIGWSLFAIVLFGIFGAIYYFFFRYKWNGIIFKMSGSGNEGEGYVVGKIIKDKALKKKDGSFSFFKLKKNTDPWESKYTYPGNTVFGFEKDGKIYPGKVTCAGEHCAGEHPSINPLPFAIRKKAELELQQAAMEYAKTDWWSQNKSLVTATVTVLICCALAGFVIWLAFIRGEAAISQASSLMDRVMTTIPAATPPG